MKAIITEEQRKQLLEEYARIWGRDQRMIDFCMNRIQRAITLSNGDLVVIEKQHIKKHLEPFAFIHYYGGEKLMEIRMMDAYGDKAEIERLHAYKLSEKDAADLRQAYEEERGRHIKRLETYLKKYGLTKLHVWTYLVD